MSGKKVADLVAAGRTLRLVVVDRTPRTAETGRTLLRLVETGHTSLIAGSVGRRLHHRKLVGLAAEAYTHRQRLQRLGADRRQELHRRRAVHRTTSGAAYRLLAVVVVVGMVEAEQLVGVFAVAETDLKRQGYSMTSSLEKRHRKLRIKGLKYKDSSSKTLRIQNRCQSFTHTNLEVADIHRTTVVGWADLEFPPWDHNQLTNQPSVFPQVELDMIRSVKTSV